MIKKLFITTVLFGLIIAPVMARETAQIELSLSDSEVAVGDSFQVSVSLKNASTGSLNIGNITIPGLENFQQVGSSKSTKIQMINGATTAVTETVLSLVALSSGDYSIGPIKLKVGGEEVVSNTESIKVTEKKQKSFFQKKNNVNKPTKTVSAISNKQSKIDWSKIWDSLVDVLALVLLVVLIYAFLRQRENRKSSVFDKSKEEEKLEPSKIELPDINDEEFFKKTKKVLLQYLENKYQVDLASLTSKELLEKIKEKRVVSLDQIKRALDLCDQGNFALGQDGKEELIKIIKSLI